MTPKPLELRTRTFSGLFALSLRLAGVTDTIVFGPNVSGCPRGGSRSRGVAGATSSVSLTLSAIADENALSVSTDFSVTRIRRVPGGTAAVPARRRSVVT